MDVLKEDVKLVLVVFGEEDADCDDVWTERMEEYAGLLSIQLLSFDVSFNPQLSVASS